MMSDGIISPKLNNLDKSRPLKVDFSVQPNRITNIVTERSESKTNALLRLSFTVNNPVRRRE